MLKTFFNDNSFIRQKKSKKYFQVNNRTLTPIKLICQNSTNIFNKKTNTTYNLKMLNKKEKFAPNQKLKYIRNFNDINCLNTDCNNISNNENNSFSNYIKTTMDTNITNMTKTKLTKDKENLSFGNDNTFIHYTPSTNYQSSNVKKRNIRKKIKIPKQKENFLLSKNKSKNKNVNKTFIIPNRLSSLISVEQNILNPIKQKSKIVYKKTLLLNKKVNNIKDKINLINIRRKSLDATNLLLKKSKLKNICQLFGQKMESISNKEKTKDELKKEIEKLKNKIKKIKKETNDMNIKKEKIKEEIINDKNKLINIKENIENIKSDKKKVNAMLILLHKRIIDIKNRIQKREEHNLYLDKSFFELNQRFQNLI